MMESGSPYPIRLPPNNFFRIRADDTQVRIGTGELPTHAHNDMSPAPTIYLKRPGEQSPPIRGRAGSHGGLLRGRPSLARAGAQLVL